MRDNMIMSQIWYSSGYGEIEVIYNRSDKSKRKRYKYIIENRYWYDQIIRRYNHHRHAECWIKCLKESASFCVELTRSRLKGVKHGT